MCPFDDANQGPAAYYGTFATSPQSSWATEGILPADKCPGNPQPTTNFESPRTGSEATITFKPVDENDTSIPDARIHVGRYEGRVTPIADTDPTTSIGTTAKFVPGTYEFVIAAPGYGLSRHTREFTASTTKTTKFYMATNWASVNRGATATGDGANLEA